MPHTYQPLRGKDDFRLIELLPSVNDNDDLACRLTVCRIPGLGTSAKTVEYEAVSYVWGTELSSQLILVDGWERQVGQNLWSFLHRARTTLASGPRRFWIDALCIDQANVAERNVQVQQMGAIYRAATRTLVWLGTGDVDIALAMKYIGELKYKDMVSFGRGDCPLAALKSWLHLPYWTRTWIVQEFLISPELLLMYETHCVHVRATLLFIKSLLDARTEDKSDEVVQSLLTSPGAVLLLQRLSPASQFTLAGLIIKNQHSRCLEPRDKIYGVLSLLREQPSILIDYDSDIRSLFRDVLCIWSEQDGSVPNLLQLGTLLAKVLHLSTDLSEPTRENRTIRRRASTTTDLSLGRKFPVRLYAVGKVDCHIAIENPSQSGQGYLSVDGLDQIVRSDPRFLAWVRRFINPEEFMQMVKQLALRSHVVTWLQRFWLMSRRVGVSKDDSTEGRTASLCMPTISLVGVSLSMLRSHKYAIGIALGSIQTGDLILQALYHEMMFVRKCDDEYRRSTPSLPAVLSCARSGEPSFDPLTHRSIPFVAVTSEAEIKNPPLCSVIYFTVQEMLILCSG